jgi:GNAT superfamily N-acetyltransferase
MAALDVRIKRLEGTMDAQQAYCCMMEVPTPWSDALCDCRDWVQENLGEYVEGFHAQLEDGTVVGHLYYAPSERALIPYQVEAGVGVLYCEWVQRKYQGLGIGRRLFDAFREEMERSGAKGILVEATDLRQQMHESHFLRRGFRRMRAVDHSRLLYLPLSAPEVEVQPMEARVTPRQGLPVEILILSGYMCPFETATMRALREVALEFQDKVELREVQLTPESLQEYGVARGIFINGKQKLSGGEPEAAIRQAIREEL